MAGNVGKTHCGQILEILYGFTLINGTELENEIENDVPSICLQSNYLDSRVNK